MEKHALILESEAFDSLSLRCYIVDEVYLKKNLTVNLMQYNYLAEN